MASTNETPPAIRIRDLVKRYAPTGKAPGKLARVERFVAGEQHRLYRAFEIVDHAGCPIGAAFR